MYNQSTSDVIAQYGTAGGLESINGDSGIDVVQASLHKVQRKRGMNERRNDRPRTSGRKLKRQKGSKVQPVQLRTCKEVVTRVSTERPRLPPGVRETFLSFRDDLLGRTR